MSLRLSLYWRDANAWDAGKFEVRDADCEVCIRALSYQNCDLNSVLKLMSKWPDAIPRSDPFDNAIAIKAFASTNPPHPNRSVEYLVRSLA